MTECEQQNVPLLIVQYKDLIGIWKVEELQRIIAFCTGQELSLEADVLCNYWKEQIDSHCANTSASSTPGYNKSNSKRGGSSSAHKIGKSLHHYSHDLLS